MLKLSLRGIRISSFLVILAGQVQKKKEGTDNRYVVIVPTNLESHRNTKRARRGFKFGRDITFCHLSIPTMTGEN